MGNTFDFDKIQNPTLREEIRAVFAPADGHDHDGTNSKLVVGGAPADNSVTNLKMAADAKVGSLAALTTTEKGSLQGAINEVDGIASAAYVKPALGIPKADLVAAVQASLDLADTALQVMAIPTATPVNAVAASKLLTIDGVVIDGETITIGADKYEFCADAAQSLTAGSTIAVDIESISTKSAGTLTVDTQPTAGDTMTIGTKVYTFVPDGTANADGEISRGTDLPSAKLAIVAAINGVDGHNVAHTLVSAAAFGGADACVITALVGGVAGDLIATTETFTAGTNVFDAGTLGTTVAGVDAAIANAAAALAAEVAAHDTQGVGATDAGGGLVTFTADVKGTAGNAIVIAETMAHGAFAGGAVLLSGGVNGTVGNQWDVKVDASYLYVCIAAQTIVDTNWRRVTLGAAY